MERGLNGARDDLNSTCEAGRRRNQQSHAFGCDPAGRRNLGDHRGIGQCPGFEDSHHRLGLFAIADLVEKRFLAVRRPHRSGAHREKLPLLDRPPRILAREAGRDGMIGADLYVRKIGVAELARHESDIAKTREADPCEIKTGRESSAGFDAAVENSAAVFDHARGEFAFLGAIDQGVDKSEGSMVEILHDATSPAANEDFPLTTGAEVAIVPGECA